MIKSQLSRAARAALCLFALVAIVDGPGVLQSIEGLSISEAAPALAALLSAQAALVSGSSLCLGLPLLLALALRKEAMTKTRVALIAAVALAPLFVLLWLVLGDLFGGNWIRRQAWTPLAKGLLLIAAFAAGAFAFRLFLRAKKPALFGFAFLLGIPLLLIVDAKVLVGHYPAFHLALSVGALALAFWAGLLIAGPAPRRALDVAGLVILGTGLAGIAALATGRLPGDDLQRRLMLREGRLLPRVLLELLPPPELSADADAVERARRALRARPRPRAGAIDARFPERGKGNLVMITLDTLRPDHLSCYGYERQTSPAMDALAAEGIVFDAASSPFPSSPLAMAAMFKGRWPTATDAYELKGRDGLKPEDFPNPPIAQRFLDAGFATAAVTSMPSRFLASSMAYAPAGFDSFENVPPTGAVYIEEIQEKVQDALGKLDGPFFLWVHIFNPHSPYNRHEAFDFGDGNIDRYDSEIAYADDHVGRILDTLRARDDWGRSVVVINSDHGEEFGEHGSFGHHSSVYEEQVRVPLIMRIPGVKPGRVSSPASLVDLPPTFRDLFSLEPITGNQGRSLLPLVAPELYEPFELGLAGELMPIAFNQFRENRLSPARPRRFALRRLEAHPRPALRRLELYDLKSDPGETVDRSRDEPERLAELQALLVALRKETGAPEADAGPEEATTPKERLAAMDRQLLGGVFDGVEAETLALLEEKELDAADRLKLWRYLSILPGERSGSAVAKLVPKDDEAMARAAALALALRGDGSASSALRELESGPAGELVRALAPLSEGVLTDVTLEQSGEARLEAKAVQR